MRLILALSAICFFSVACAPERKAEWVSAPEADVVPDVCRKRVQMTNTDAFFFYCVDGYKFYALATYRTTLVRALDAQGNQVPCKCRYKEKEKEEQ
jgi:hypothetical protein